MVRVTDAMISDEKDEMGSVLGYTDRRFPPCCVVNQLYPNLEYKTGRKMMFSFVS